MKLSPQLLNTLISWVYWYISSRENHYCCIRKRLGYLKNIKIKSIIISKFTPVRYLYYEEQLHRSNTLIMLMMKITCNWYVTGYLKMCMNHKPYCVLEYFYIMWHIKDFFIIIYYYLHTYVFIYLCPYLLCQYPEYLPIYLPIYLSISCSTCCADILSIYLSFLLFIFFFRTCCKNVLNVYLPINLSKYLSIYLSPYYLFIPDCTCCANVLSVYLPINLSKYLSIYLNIYLPIIIYYCLYLLR